MWFKEVGQINSIEMLKTFNCGIGLILATNANESKKVIDYLKIKGINAYIIGKISKKKKQTISFYKKIWTMGLNLGILISGRGSNMLNLVNASQRGLINSKIKIVISNNKNSSGIDKAKRKISKQKS